MLLCARVLSLEFGLVHRYFFQHNSRNVSSVWENRWTITQSPPYTQPHVLWELADSRLEERRTLQLAGVIQRHPPAIVRHSRNGISRCCGAFTRAYASHCHCLYLTTKKTPSVHFAVKLSLAVFALQSSTKVYPLGVDFGSCSWHQKAFCCRRLAICSVILL